MASEPHRNGDLLQQINELESAWASCADKVDSIVNCQERNHEQTAVVTSDVE